jgi:tetratricopeptide (TPR) repeat protein
MAPPPLPPVPPEAARWYERGAEAVREGAYRSGQLALEEAIRLHAMYPLAHARLAEAFAELDEERAAQEQLLRLASLVPDESRLPGDERLRVAGIRALVLRDLDASVAIYRQLTERRPRDATAWFDLGRVQESAGTQDAALASYARARTLDPQFAAAHLRIGSIHANELQTREALASFGEAERLYRSAANTEGEAEVLLRRGGLYDALGQLKDARTDLDRALSLARTLKTTHQMVRAQLALSSVTASEGRLAESSQLASAAVETALSMGLDSVAAAGLVDLAATLQSSHVPEAAAQAERALELAERRGARRTAARARLQLAAVRNEQQRPRDAVTLATQALAFLQPNRYRRYEFYGLLILSRAYEQLGDLERARAASADVLAATEALGHEGQVGVALSNLASLATALGRLPEALTLRERAERIRRAQRDASALPYDLANRADLLIRLGRLEEALEPLGELEAGIDAGVETYVGRARRVAFLRGFSAVVACHNDEAATILERLAPFESDSTSVGLLAPAVYEYALAHGRRGPPRGRGQSPSREEGAEPVVARERQYWLAAAALGRGDARAALAGAEHGLELLGTVPNDELRWRLAAVGAAAAAQLRDGPAAASLQARMTRALEQLRANWPGGLGTYERRPDLVELRTRVGK